MKPEVFDIFFSAFKKKYEILQTAREAFSIYQLIERVKNIEGDFIEIGSYSGGSAKLISLFKQNSRKFYIFDTFEGLADTGPLDTGLKNGYLCYSNLETFKTLLSDSSVIIQKGYFPQCAGELLNSNKFSFVHLDVDTYESTRNCLDFFNNKMAKGGIILTHDYSHPALKGVKKAFDEFHKGEIGVRIQKTSQLFVEYA